MRFVKSLQIQRNLLPKHPNFANVRFLYNGQYVKDLALDETVQTGELFPSGESWEKKQLISLVYWFKDGWTVTDKENVASAINQFTNLKYLLTDTTFKQLQSIGFDFKVHQLAKSLVLNGNPLVGGKCSRNWYIHIFHVQDLPTIPDSDFPAPVTLNSLDNQIASATNLFEEMKQNRHLNAKLDDTKRFIPGEKNKPCPRKRKTSSSYYEPPPKSTKLVDLNKVQENLDIIDKIEYPKDCVDIKSKLLYISKSRSNFSLKKQSNGFSSLITTPPTAHKTVVEVLENIESSHLANADIMLLIEKLQEKVNSSTHHALPSSKTAR